MKKLLNLLFEEEQTFPPKKEEVKPQAQVVMQSSVRPMAMPIAGISSVEATPVLPENGKIKEALKEELNKNIEGTPYSLYLRTIEVLKPSIPDQSVRCVAASGSLTAQGFTKAQLLDSIQTKGINFLNNEFAAFEQDINKQLNEIQTYTDNQIVAIDDTVKKKREEIERLTKEILEHNQQKDILSADLVHKKAKLELAKMEFSSAHKNLVQEIQSDLDNITKLIGG